MKYRELGRTGWRVSTVSFGAWAIGGTWGTVSDRDSLAALHRALEAGVNFFDTADVYGDGRSERLLARLPLSSGMLTGKFGPIPHLHRTTTGLSIGGGSPSTAGRRFRAWNSRPG